MKRVRLLGLSDERRITSSDWESVGVSSKETVWYGQGDVVELSNAAADWLLTYAPHEFQVQGETAEDEAVVEAQAAADAGTAGEDPRLAEGEVAGGGSLGAGGGTVGGARGGRGRARG